MVCVEFGNDVYFFSGNQRKSFFFRGEIKLFEIYEKIKTKSNPNMKSSEEQTDRKNEGGTIRPLVGYKTKKRLKRKRLYIRYWIEDSEIKMYLEKDDAFRSPTSLGHTLSSLFFDIFPPRYHKRINCELFTFCNKRDARSSIIREHYGYAGFWAMPYEHKVNFLAALFPVWVVKRITADIMDPFRKIRRTLRLNEHMTRLDAIATAGVNAEKEYIWFVMAHIFLRIIKIFSSDVGHHIFRYLYI